MLAVFRSGCWFPLVFLVLPAFVLLTVVPGLAAGLGRL
jgi:hypothetical protein